MNEPMSDARLAEIHAIGYADDHKVIGELLAEVERLRQEDPMVTAMREYMAKLKRGAFWLAVYVIVGIAVWDLCNHTLGLPGPVSVLACFFAGVPLGGLQAWIEDRREAGRG